MEEALLEVSKRSPGTSVGGATLRRRQVPKQELPGVGSLDLVTAGRDSPCRGGTLLLTGFAVEIGLKTLC